MIVQCPNCDSRYRVNDANVPASGGKITCPSCKDKFIVYPETASAPDTAAHSAFEDKTSVARRPDLRQLVDQMSPSNDDAGAETEVMSPLHIPSGLHFKSDEAPAEDGTVEMSSPDIANLRAQHEASLYEESEVDDSASTEILDSDALDHMSFNEPLNPQDPAHYGETRERAPLRTQLVSSSSTERLAPDAVSIPRPPATPSPPGERPPLPTPFGAAKTPPTRPPAPAMPSPAMPAPAIPAPPKPAPEPASAPSPAPLESGGTDPAHEGPWKLKTNFGLTYEFSDNASLQNWLSNREDLEGYELAGDDDFFPVSSWPQFQPKRASYNPNRTFGMAAIPQKAPRPQAQPASPNFSTPDRPASGPFDQASATPQPGMTPAPGPAAPRNWDSLNTAEPPRKIIQPNTYRAPSRDSKLNWILWPIIGVLFAVGVLLLVQLLGVYDIKSAVLGETVTESADPQEFAVDEPGAAPSADEAQEGEDAPQKTSPEVTKAVDRLLRDAEQAIENNRLQSASVKLNNAKLLDPERVSIYVLFVEVYTQMGRPEDAQAAQKTLDELRGTTPPAVADDPGDEREDEDSDAP